MADADVHVHTGMKMQHYWFVKFREPNYVGVI